MNPETFEYVKTWAATTQGWLQKGISALKVQKSGELKSSIKHEISQSNSQIRVRFSFMLKGKFSDMGAGTSQKANTRKTKRKAKKWFSKNYYGGIASLRNVLQVQLQSEVRKIFENNYEL